MCSQCRCIVAALHTIIIVILPIVIDHGLSNYDIVGSIYSKPSSYGAIVIVCFITIVVRSSSSSSYFSRLL